MPTALEDLFHQSRKNNQAVLLGYIPAGFPTQKKSKKNNQGHD